MRTTVLALTLFSAVVTPAPAQHVDFGALRDSLRRMGDTTAVRQLELARRPGKAATPAAHVQHGLVALRLYDLTADRAAVRRAQQAFEKAVAAQPANGWAQYGLGLALAHSPEAKLISEGGKPGFFVLDDVFERTIGTDARSRARRAFNAALKAVPPINQAARELAELALRTQKQDALDEAAAALEQLVQRGTALLEDHIALSAVLNALDRTADAQAAAQRALATDPRSAHALYAAAIAELRASGQEERGRKLYADAIQRADGELLDELWRDVLPVATSVERTRWQSGDEAARRELLARFWDLRAGLGGVTVSDRLAEHYRRLATAERRYRRQAEFRAPERNELRLLPAQRRSRFDDRGEIYVRHGEPLNVIRSHDFEVDKESWVYLQPDRSVRLFHFLKYGPDYVLPYMVPCDLDHLDQAKQYEPRLAGLRTRCTDLNVAAYSADMRQVFYEALATDTRYPNFVRDLPFLYDLYTFRGAPGKTTVVAAFAVPANELEPSDEEGGVKYRFDLSLILADTAAGTVSRTDDSARVVMPRPLRDEELLRAHLEVQVPPSATTLQRVIVTDPSEPGIGQLYGGPFPIPDYSGSSLMLSDIALAQPNAARGWKRGEVTLALVPSNRFAGGEFSMYYEIYNLPAGNRYTTEVVIDRTDKGTAAKLRQLLGGSSAISFRFAGESTADASGTVRELQRLGNAAQLGKGRYRMTITVKNLETGATAKNSRFFIIPN